MAALSFLDREHTVAPPGYSRWLIPPAALAVHLCIGQVYATSVYKEALREHFETSLTAIGVIFSIAIVMLGVSAAVFGTWVDRVGPRRAMFTAACCWTSGFLIGAVGGVDEPPRHPSSCGSGLPGIGRRKPARQKTRRLAYETLFNADRRQ